MMPLGVAHLFETWYEAYCKYTATYHTPDIVRLLANVVVHRTSLEDNTKTGVTASMSS